ncbi:MAG: leucine--tRNA ligase [Patescibacteria group bacterium]
MNDYNHLKIEKKWQKIWEKNKLNQAKDQKFPRGSASVPRSSAPKKFYGLIEFPYPSGDGLHVGHIRSNTAMDVIARKRRAEGFEVLYPIGWDAFGLPTENYAIKTGIHPAIVTKKNTENFQRQLKELGFSFDWSREINTTDPEYYKWTQWIFLKFLEKGLAYKKKMAINWCPKDKIGLANEEVVDGCCERCGTPVEKREKEQWMLAITKYADRLDRDLDNKKILIGTRNPAKVKMIKTCLAGVAGIELLSLDDVPPVDDSSLIEGDDFKENARMKSEFYFKKTGFPTIATDNIFWIEKWPENNGVMVHMRKHANPNSERATDEEVIEFLKNFLKTVGGSSPANFHYATSFTDEAGSMVEEVVPSDYILQDEQTKNYWPGYPTEAFLKDAQTGVFKSDQSDEVRYKKVISLFHEKFVSRMLAGHTPIEYLEKIKLQQKNWIGKSEGAQIRFKIQESGFKNEISEVDVFTTRIDTIFSGTFLVVAPEHPIIKKLAKSFENLEEIERFISNSKKKTDIERTDKENKTGVQLKGIEAINPATLESMAVWVSDFVLGEYGTGAVFADAHDKRDFDMAKKYGIPLKVSIKPSDPVLFEKVKTLETCYEGEGILFNSGTFDGLTSKEARPKIVEWLKEKGFAEKIVKYKIRDWVFSRQRYWGEPIPVIHCEKCGIVPLAEKDLPLKLPNVKNYKPTDTGESPLASISKWVNVKCPVCKGPARRETDTMPNWAGSSWYYLAYVVKKGKSFDLKNKSALDYWTPVDWYNGGMEHTTLHLLYSRFWHKFLFDLGLVPTSEPYLKRTSHGLILGEGGVKMSKSLGNVVNPDTLIKTFGADTLRLYEMFMGPFDQHIAWSTESMVGPRRFLERVWKLKERITIQESRFKNRNQENPESKIVNHESTLLHKTIKKVSEDIEAMRFNTAVSAMMVLLNEFEKAETVSRKEYEILLQLLAPFAPHITDELWSLLGNKKSIHLSSWPVYDSKLASKSGGVLVIQVNGKMRSTLNTETELTEAEAKELALNLPEIKKWIAELPIKKLIYVKGRLLNVVV